MLFCRLEAGKRLDIVRSEVVLDDLVGDVHCIIEAMIGKGGPVALQQPQLLGVPEVRWLVIGKGWFDVC
jgi:hypothetical protein